MNEDDMKQVAQFIDEGIKIAIEVNTKLATQGKPTVKLFKEHLRNDEFVPKIAELRKKVEEFALNFPIPGFDDY